MKFDAYIKMVNSAKITIFIFVSISSILLFRPGSAKAKLILEPSGTITPFVENPMPDGEVRERIQDVVGRLQSVSSRLRGIIEDTRSYAQETVRERGVDVGAVDRTLTQAEDQLSRADAQTVALSQDNLVSARSQFRRIQTTLFSARDLLRDALGELLMLDQQQTTPASVPNGPTVAPSL